MPQSVKGVIKVVFINEGTLINFLCLEGDKRREILAYLRIYQYICTKKRKVLKNKTW